VYSSTFFRAVAIFRQFFSAFCRAAADSRDVVPLRALTPLSLSSNVQSSFHNLNVFESAIASTSQKQNRTQSAHKKTRAASWNPQPIRIRESNQPAQLARVNFQAKINWRAQFLKRASASTRQL